MIEESLIVISFMILVFLYWTYREDVGKELVLAGIITAIWVGSTGLYNYKGNNLSLYNITIYPFMLWTLALVVFKEFSEFLDTKVKDQFKYWGIIITTWLFFIVTVEYIGYNCLGIQLSNGDPGLFGYSLLHIPVYGQIYYLTAGTLFVGITKLLKVK